MFILLSGRPSDNEVIVSSRNEIYIGVSKMNWDQIEGNWKQVKGKLREKWGDLTDDDWDRIAGKRENLVGKIQEKYGKTREEAEKEVEDWQKTYH
jgi:uncharacterized protein YjbJ (UPF0337 family)